MSSKSTTNIETSELKDGKIDVSKPKKNQEKEDEKIVLRKYNFTGLGKTVKARTLKEACEIVKNK